MRAVHSATDSVKPSRNEGNNFERHENNPTAVENIIFVFPCDTLVVFLLTETLVISSLVGIFARLWHRLNGVGEVI